MVGECLDNAVGQNKMRHKSEMVRDGLAMKGKSRAWLLFRSTWLLNIVFALSKSLCCLDNFGR